MRIIEYTTHLNDDRIPVLVREKSSNIPSVDCLNNPKKIADMINTIYNATNLTEEYVWALAFNAKMKLIAIFEISHGLINGSLLTPREVFIKLCLCGAYGFVLVHNHPSGDCCPSTEDKNLTMQMRQCGELMNINLIDHLIVGNGYYSFKENS